MRHDQRSSCAKLDRKITVGYGSLVAIDRATRRTSIYVARTISSYQGTLAWAKATRDLQLTSPAALTDNGSENLGAFAELLMAKKIPRYFARPQTPKDKPYVERAIGRLSVSTSNGADS